MTKDFKEYTKFMKIKALKAEKKELEERLKICAKSVGEFQKKLARIELEIDVKIVNYAQNTKTKLSHKFIVGMLQQIKRIL